MAGEQIAGDVLPGNLAGMSKSQLYDIMSQMKALIEQNQQQARQILIQNPMLTKALFQAQIMLGMVQPPKTPSASPQPQLPVQPAQQPSIQATFHMPGPASGQEQTSSSQIHIPARKQHPSQSAALISSASFPAAEFQPQSMPLQSPQTTQQHKGHLNAQVTPPSLSQSTQLPFIPPLPPNRPASQPSTQNLPLLNTISSQLQQPLQSASIQQVPMQQPPLPPQPRPQTPMQPLPHQFQSQMGPNVGFQHSGAPQLHHSQPMFHSGTKIPASMGPPFPQGQQIHSSQPPLQMKYQMGGPHMGSEFNSQVGNSKQPDRVSAWMPGQPENTMGVQLPGLPPLTAPPAQTGSGNQPAQPPPLSPEMEKQLLQQVMSLTPEQIYLLPPEHRNQVLQLQQMLRQ